jgi:phosphodiesterase/alkaline phosphatase D-like protein
METTQWTRRRFLKVVGAGAGLAALGQWRPLPIATADVDPAPFTLGVASGDPAHNSVVLWTRLAPDPLAGGGMSPAPVSVRWEVARNEAFTKIAHRGTALASPDLAHSVHVEVKGLPPDRWYWYRFDVDGQASRIGRTRTLPPPGAKSDRLRFAFASCQAWAGGPYPAYRDMAEQDLDFVVHLGDYIYETAGGSLEEFRRLHSLYKTSPDLRAAHARFPFITTWDDHEVQNNYAADVAGGAGDGRPFLERRANGYQAYYEHLPLRRAEKPQGPDALLYRRLAFGRLAEFSVLDTRQYRSDQACGDGRREPCEEAFDPARTMTGPEQERWLLEGLDRSKARWNMVAQQTIMAAFDYDIGPDEIVNLDQWDGYPAARDRILGFVRERRPSNPVVISGDWHSNWVNDLKADFDDPDSETLATEFAGTSIASGIGWDAAVRDGLPANPHVRFYEGGFRGYVLCDVTPERLEAELRIVTDPGDAAAPAYTLAAFEVADGRPGARRLDAGTGIVARAADATSGAGLPNVEIQVRTAAGSVLAERLTDRDGNLSVFAPPGSYEVTANGVGYRVASRTLTVAGTTPARAEFALEPAPLSAGTGRILPGPQAEGRAGDIVLENSRIAMTLSAVTEDGQLSPTTRGKPLDLAARGFVDRLDWMNLPYASVARPRGGNAWQQRTVRSTGVEVASVDAERAVVRATGASTAFPDLAVVTTYRLERDADEVQAETVFTNAGAAPSTVWLGDVIDHDGTGQRSGVAGHGTITASAPADFVPTAPWIAMTGTDRLLYALVYAEGGFTAYAAFNWVMSQRQVTIAPGESFALDRRILAVRAADGNDPWAVLA